MSKKKISVIPEDVEGLDPDIQEVYTTLQRIIDDRETQRESDPVIGEYVSRQVWTKIQKITPIEEAALDALVAWRRVLVMNKATIETKNELHDVMKRAAAELCGERGFDVAVARPSFNVSDNFGE